MSMSRPDLGLDFHTKALARVFSSSLVAGDRRRVGEISRGAQIILRGTDPAANINECTLEYED
jgi:hypothetical protein